MDLKWADEKRVLSQLKPWEHNPRTINKTEAARLVESFETFGQVEPIVIGPDDEVYNGHQRLSVLKKQFGDKYEVSVRVASRPLSEKERQKLTVFLHRGTVGEWDWDSLANRFEMDELLEWGFTEYDLQIHGVSEDKHARPDFEGIIEEFKEPEGKKKSESKEDGNWFYVEFYGRDREYEELKALIGDGIKSEHQLDAEWFLELMRKAARAG